MSNDFTPYDKIGTQKESISVNNTVDEERKPTFEKMPFSARKYYYKYTHIYYTK